MKEAFHKMIELRRSIRKFKPEPVDSAVLAKLVDAARLCPSAANKQPLVYIVVNEPGLAKKIYETEKFAAYLGEAGQPKPGDEPTAHILIAQDKELAIAETVRDVVLRPHPRRLRRRRAAREGEGLAAAGVLSAR